MADRAVLRIVGSLANANNPYAPMLMPLYAQNTSTKEFFNILEEFFCGSSLSKKSF